MKELEPVIALTFAARSLAPDNFLLFVLSYFRYGRRVFHRSRRGSATLTGVGLCGGRHFMPARQRGRKERGGRQAQYARVLISHALPRESFFLACPPCAISPLHGVLVFHAITTCTFEPFSGCNSTQLRERLGQVLGPRSTILEL